MATARTGLSILFGIVIGFHIRLTVLEDQLAHHIEPRLSQNLHDFLVAKNSSQQVQNESTSHQLRMRPNKAPSISSHGSTSFKALKLPTPVIALSFPKSGTTSLYAFFNCSGIVTQHYCSRGDLQDHHPCANGTMTECILKNMGQGRPMLKDCGDDFYQVFTQLDAERPAGKPDLKAKPNEQRKTFILTNGSHAKIPQTHFLPQHFELEQVRVFDAMNTGLPFQPG
jgi:uncharacterized protein YneF (UPF0154 family)